MNKLKKEIDLLEKYTNDENFNYLNCLLYPEKYKGVRIPSNLPTPSCTFQLKTTRILESNEKGCLLIKCNPYFLAQKSLIGSIVQRVFNARQGNTNHWYFTRWYLSTIASSCSYFNGSWMDGINKPDLLETYRFVDLDMDQVIPNNVYDQYRLVSASLKLKYIGPIEETQGVIGGAIILEEYNDLSCDYYYDRLDMTAATPIPTVQPYDPNHKHYPTGICVDNFCNFDDYRHSYYHQENSCLDGIRMLYFPSDNSFEEYTKILSNEKQIGVSGVRTERSTTDGNMTDWIYPYFVAPQDVYKSGFNWFIYCQGVPANKAYFRLELCANYECIPTNLFLNYCNAELNPFKMDVKERQMVYQEVRKNAIQKYS